MVPCSTSSPADRNNAAQQLDDRNLEKIFFFLICLFPRQSVILSNAPLFSFHSASDAGAHRSLVRFVGWGTAQSADTHRRERWVSLTLNPSYATPRIRGEMPLFVHTSQNV